MVTNLEESRVKERERERAVTNPEEIKKRERERESSRVFENFEKLAKFEIIKFEKFLKRKTRKFVNSLS